MVRAWYAMGECTLHLSVTRQPRLLHCPSPKGMVQPVSGGNEEVGVGCSHGHVFAAVLLCVNKIYLETCLQPDAGIFLVLVATCM